MKKYEKEVQQAFLNNEEAVIKRLKQVYNQSLKDINSKAQDLQNQINALQVSLDTVEDAAEKERLKSMIQSKVYQRDYQMALKKQVSTILDEMHISEFKTVSEYLTKCYDEGFMGAMYSLQQQGIPLIIPMDQTALVRAVQLDSKISNGLYTRLGEDIAVLKKKITATVSRGISTGISWQQMAQQLAGYTNIGYNNAVRICRTEGHRIQIQSAENACHEAKAKGADIVRQWDSTLDGATRPSHQKVDGEIRELDKKFSNGLMFPGDPSGGAAEVINCRCALLQRAKWALDKDELETLKERAEYFGLDKADTFDEYKEKYLKAAEEEKKGNPFDPYSFTDEQSKAIEWYVSGEGQYINQYHRGRVGSDFGELSDDEKRFSDLLDEATDRTIPSNIDSLYRSVDAKAIFGDIDDGDWYDIESAILYGDKYSQKKVQPLIDRTKGKTITEKGFMSTTKKLDVAEEWGDFTGSSMPLTIEFDDIPKGLKGADLKRFDIDGDEQFEVLLARGTRYEITDIYAKNGQVHVKAKFIVDDVADVADDMISSVIKAEKMDISNFPSAFSVKSEKKNTEKFVEYVNSLEGANADTIKLYNSMGKLESIESNGIPFKIAHGKNHAVQTTMRYNGDLVEVKLNIPKLSGDDLTGQINTMLHEEMHLMDLYCRTDKKKAGGWFSTSRKPLVDIFNKTSDEMSDEISDLFKQFKEEYNKTKDAVREAYRKKRADLKDSYYPNGESIWSDLSKYKQYEKEAKKIDKWLDEELDYQCRNIMGGGVNALQDIYDALSGGAFRGNGTVIYGHDSNYYRSTESRVHETIANYGTLSVLRPDLVEMLRKDKPDLVTELEATVKEMLGKVGE